MFTSIKMSPEAVTGGGSTSTPWYAGVRDIYNQPVREVVFTGPLTVSNPLRVACFRGQVDFEEALRPSPETLLLSDTIRVGITERAFTNKDYQRLFDAMKAAIEAKGMEPGQRTGEKGCGLTFRGKDPTAYPVLTYNIVKDPQSGDIEIQIFRIERGVVSPEWALNKNGLFQDGKVFADLPREEQKTQVAETLSDYMILAFTRFDRCPIAANG